MYSNIKWIIDICFNLNDDSIIDVLYEDFEYIEYKVDDEFVSKLRK